MVHLDLTDEEQQILADLLEEAIGDLRMEIADTDRVDYREMLKHRERVLKKLLAVTTYGPTSPTQTT
jgi:hypothetical protein